MPNNQQLEQNARQLISIAKANPNPKEARLFLKNLAESNPMISELASSEMDSPDFIFQNLTPPEIKYLIRKLSTEVLSWIDKRESDEDFKNLWKSWTKTLKPIKASKNDLTKSPQDLFFEVFFRAISESKIKFDLGLLFTKPKQTQAIELKKAEHSIFIQSRIISPSSLVTFSVFPRPQKNFKIEVYNGIYKILEKKFKVNDVNICKFWGSEFMKKIPSYLKNESLILPVLLLNESNHILAHSSFILLPEDPPKYQVSLDLSLLEMNPTIASVKDGNNAFTGELELSLCDAHLGDTVYSGKARCEKGKLEIINLEASIESSSSYFSSVYSPASDRVSVSYIPGANLLHRIEALPNLDLNIPDTLYGSETLKITSSNKNGIIYFYFDTNENLFHSFLENFRISDIPDNKEKWIQEMGSKKTTTPLIIPNEPHLYFWDLSQTKTMELNESFSPGLYFLHFFQIDEKGEVFRLKKKLEVRIEGDRPTPIRFATEPNFQISNRQYWEITTEPPEPISVFYQNKNPDLLKSLPVGTKLSLDDFLIQLAWLLWNYKMDCGEQTSSRLFAYWILYRYGYAPFLNNEIFNMLCDKIQSYYSSEDGLFTIWSGVENDIRFNERFLPLLNVFTDTDLPISGFVKNVISEMKSKQLASHSFVGMDGGLIPKEGEPSFSQFWNQIWKNPKRYLSLIETEHRNGFASNVGMWDTREISAYRFLLYNAVPDLQVPQYKTMVNEKNLTIWDQITNLVGMTEIPDKEVIQKQTVLYDYNHFQKNDFSNFWNYQAGTRLTGSTASTVAFLQALIALRRLRKNVFFELKEKGIEGNASSEKKRNQKSTSYRMKQFHFLRRWEVGRLNHLQIELDKGLTYNGILCFEVPSNVEILTNPNQYMVRYGNKVEIPLQAEKYLSIRFVVKSPGSGAIHATLYEMYSNFEMPLMEEMIEIKP